MNVQSFTVGGQPQQRQQHPDVVIEGEFEEITDPPKNTKPGTSGWTKD